MSIRLEQLERIAADAGLAYRQYAYQLFPDASMKKELWDFYMSAIRDVEREKQALLVGRQTERRAAKAANPTTRIE